MLLNREYMQNRNVEYYADRLYVVPHYLSEVSKQISLQPASYWIERFAVRELSGMLADTSLSFDDICERMNFSSLSYFSRYVKKNARGYPYGVSSVNQKISY